MQLFGFLSKDGLELFKKLISVSGVGPKGGLAIISACPAILYKWQFYPEMPRQFPRHRASVQKLLREL